jgi:hypothetical protein
MKKEKQRLKSKRNEVKMAETKRITQNKEGKKKRERTEKERHSCWMEIVPELSK